MSFVRTVLGDLRPAELGPVNYHEHCFHTSPLLPGEDLDDEPASAAEMKTLLASGFSSMVDATPIGLGRRPEAVRRISQATGLHIVHVTGLHRQAHYANRPDITGIDESALAQRLCTELTGGMDGTEIRAGALKAGIGLWSITGFERRSLAAVGAASAQLGTPVLVHLEFGSAAHEVLDLLAAAGCPANQVALAHIDRNPDPGLHCDLAARGCYLGYDGAARHQYFPDSVLLDCLAAVAEAGFAEHLLLGGDVARRSRYRSYGGLPGLAYLGNRFLPRIISRLGAALATTITTTAPARWLTWRPHLTPAGGATL